MTAKLQFKTENAEKKLENNNDDYLKQFMKRQKITAIKKEKKKKKENKDIKINILLLVFVIIF